MERKNKITLIKIIKQIMMLKIKKLLKKRKIFNGN
jgi:hypothetical protein